MRQEDSKNKRDRRDRKHRRAVETGETRVTGEREQIGETRVRRLTGETRKTEGKE